PTNPTTGEPVKEWLVPRGEVEAAVADVFGRYDVGRMFCDPPRWRTEIERWADRWNGGEVEDAVGAFYSTNQPKRLSEARDRFLTEIGRKEQPLTHDGDSTLTAHVLAMVRKKAYVKIEDDQDGRVRYVFVKPADGRKIDAGIAAVLAVEAAMTMPAA